MSSPLPYTYRQNSSGGDRDIATNWESLDVPLLAYQSVLVAFDKWNMARAKFDDEPRAKAELLSAMMILYFPLSSEFDIYLNGIYDKKTEKYQFGLKKDYAGKEKIIALCTVDTYSNLITDKIDLMKSDAILILFKVLVNWCVQYGPFKTFVDRKALDIFDEVEEESI